MENTDPRAAGPAASQAGDAGTADQQGNAPADAGNEELARQLAECEGKVAQLRDTVLRERADLDNQRKRMQRDLEQARRFANETLLADLLPVLDNLERGLAVEGSDYAALRAGVELTLRELVRVTEASGLVAVGAVGDPFDPERHEAMSMADGSDHPSGHLASVMQKGYVLNDRLLRPALVLVAK
jgi:molecular chaperone GrpE